MPNCTSHCHRIKHINVTSLLLFLALPVVLLSCSRNVYVVRHAEKISSTDSAAKMMANDPPLSEAGKVRAFVLRDELKTKHIKHIYSTNTVRTRATAEPLSQATKINIELYNNVDSLVNVIQSMKGNVLIVGHSNTVDDIVNKLCRQTKIAADLNDKEYDNLFVVKINGKKRIFSRHKYGYASNP
jgi:phosphohistidine phosphatase SixA